MNQREHGKASKTVEFLCAHKKSWRKTFLNLPVRMPETNWSPTLCFLSFSFVLFLAARVSCRLFSGEKLFSSANFRAFFGVQRIGGFWKKAERIFAFFSISFTIFVRHKKIRVSHFVEQLTRCYASSYTYKPITRKSSSLNCKSKFGLGNLEQPQSVLFRWSNLKRINGVKGCPARNKWPRYFY